MFRSHNPSFSGLAVRVPSFAIVVASAVGAILLVSTESDSGRELDAEARAPNFTAAGMERSYPTEPAYQGLKVSAQEAGQVVVLVSTAAEAEQLRAYLQADDAVIFSFGYSPAAYTVAVAAPPWTEADQLEALNLARAYFGAPPLKVVDLTGR